MKALLALPIIGVALVICLMIFAFVCTVYGLYLAFSVSIFLGIIALLVEPSPFVFGIVMIAFEKNLPQMIMDYLSK